MRYSAQDGTSTMWIMLIAIIGGVILCFVVIRRMNKKREAESKALYEAKRKVEIQREEENRIRLLKEKEAEENRKLEQEHRREMASVDFSGLIGSSRWDEELWQDPDQAKRIDRLRYEAPKMKVLAYDNRYHTGLVKGTSGSCYLVSGERCNCPDFLRQKKPCKHMYFLGKYVTDHGYNFLEADYEDGLKGSRAFLVGRFPGGKDAAKANLRERGCLPMEVNNSDINLAIIGNTTAQKIIENLKAKEIRMLDYKDALQIFTSEIRHPEVGDNVT